MASTCQWSYQIATLKQVLRRAIQSVLSIVQFKLNDENIVLLLGGKFIPVADHQRVKGKCAILLLVLNLIILLASTFQGAVLINSSRKCQQLGVTVEFDIGNVDREFSQLIWLSIQFMNVEDKDLTNIKVLARLIKCNMVIVQEKGVILLVV